MTENQGSEAQNPELGRPYGGRDERPEGADVAGETSGGDTQGPPTARAAEEPMDPEAVPPYTGGESDPGPANPLQSDG